MDLRAKKIFLFTLFAVLFLSPFSSLHSEAQNTQTHKVEPGETAFSIAKAYNISLNSLYALNPEAERGLKAGTLLVLPQSNVSHSPTDTDDEKYTYHTIEPKETLYSVSRNYSVPMQSLLDANSGLTAENFQVGKVIRIPKDGVQKPKKVLSYKFHKVQKGETIYSIARSYNLLSPDLLAVNPTLKNKPLKKNDLIRIPFYSEKKVTQSDVALQETKANQLLQERSRVKAVNAVKIGILLPFSDENDRQSSRFMEYLEGFLLSVEDFKQKGYSAQVYVFDIQSGETTQRLESLLETEEFKSLNVLIGGVSQSQIQILSDFAKKQKVHYVIPFSSKNDNEILNSYVFQVNTAQEQLYASISRIFASKFKTSNVIFVNDNDNDKADFVNALKPVLNKAQIANTSINLSDDIATELSAFLSTTKPNIILPASSSASTLSKLLPGLQSIEKNNADLQLSLFGYPEWQTYNYQIQNSLHQLDAYFYATFFVDNTQSDASLFSKRFVSYYGKSMLNVYPKYGLLGYDTGTYFLNAVKHYGQNFENHLSDYNANTVQLAMDFHRINNWSGFINTGFYLVHYGESGTQKKEYSK